MISVKNYQGNKGLVYIKCDTFLELSSVLSGIVNSNYRCACDFELKEVLVKRKELKSINNARKNRRKL